jgi:hypothetical protein
VAQAARSKASRKGMAPAVAQRARIAPGLMV